MHLFLSRTGKQMHSNGHFEHQIHFVSIQTVPEMHLFLSRTGKQMHFKWSFGSTKVHFVSIQTVPKMHLFLSRTGKQMHSNGNLEHQSAFREHSNCTRNAFVSESDWQANAFIWSFGSTKVHFVSIQTVPKMHLFSESDWQANAFKWSFGAPKCIS